jgi:hypothetical protein
MSQASQPPSAPLSSQEPSGPLQPVPAERRPRLAKLRSWLRTRRGRIIVPLVALLLGFGLGLSAILWYGYSGEGQVVIVPAPRTGDIIIEADRAFITDLVEKNMSASGLPGAVKNVRVDLVDGDRMTINGDDVYNLLTAQFSRHFTLIVQPYVQSCVLQIHIVHADTGGIPVTGFAQAFQNGINQQLQKKPAGLPGGFTYCTTGVRTEPVGMFITYQATPA